MQGEQIGWAALTGQSREEYQGYGWAGSVHPDDAKQTIDAWNDAVVERRTFVFEHRVRRYDGAWRLFAIRAVPIFDASDAICEWVGVHTDITDQRATEAALREESRILETFNRTGAALSAELDLERLVQRVTDAGLALTGSGFGAFFYNVLDAAGESYMLYSLAGAERSSFDSLGMPRATAVFQPTFKGEGIIRSDDIMTDPRYGQSEPHRGMLKGHLPVRSYLAVPVTSRSGEVIGGLFYGHERPGVFTEGHEHLVAGIAGQAATSIDNARLLKATQRLNDTLEARVAERSAELEKAQDDLRQAQKLEAIGQLTGGVAHDFNNLLTVIRGSVDLLRRDGISAEKRARYIDAIGETADRAAKLTGQLLAFARRQALKPEVFNAAVAITDLAEMMQTLTGSRIMIETKIPLDPAFVLADRSQFETSIINMGVNARDAMDGEGRLTISVGTVSGIPAIRRHSPVAGDFVAVTIADTGVGIEPEQIARIFEPFYTTKQVGEGTGLGLSQVLGFAKQSDGDIRVQSDMGTGTTFTLYLPRARGDVQATENAVDEEVVKDGGRICVLVVEDNKEVGEFATAALKELGYESVLATDAKHALAELDGDCSRFHIVFSDVVMPGMSGIELAEVIRQRHGDIPIILASGYSHVLAQNGQHGFELLHKPYSIEQLARVLRKSVSWHSKRKPTS